MERKKRMKNKLTKLDLAIGGERPVRSARRETFVEFGLFLTTSDRLWSAATRSEHET